MPVRLMMDVHVRRQITVGLRLRGVDVLTAQEDNSGRLADPQLLDRARLLDRVLFTQDADLLAEATARQREGIPFSGVIYAHQLAITIGQTIRDLELIAKVYDPADMADRIEFLPLR
jgi:predicted nuclease of predicted toxin-antitoxin system